MELLATDSIGCNSKGIGSKTSTKEDKPEQSNYMGPSIGNLLNGSTQPPTASAAAL